MLDVSNHAEYSFFFFLQSLDLNKEIINFEEAENVNIGDLASHVPSESARYHIYNFKHTHEGDYMECFSRLSYLF